MREQKRNVSLGVLFWIAAILLILVVFLFNRKNIERVMESTGFIEIINQRIGMDNSGDDSLPSEIPPPSSPANSDDGSGANSDKIFGPENNSAPAVARQTKEQTATEDSTSNTNSHPTEQAPKKQVADPPAEPTTEPPTISREQEAEKPSQEPKAKDRNYLIHLVRIGEDGSIFLEAIKRNVQFIASPLTETLKSLIHEPGTNGNYRNLIPPNTNLNRVWINNSTAYIDLSEEFSFNPVGTEGYRLQLQQIIATATQFSSVESVQILIDGKRIDFLGGDGLFIGQPLKESDL